MKTGVRAEVIAGRFLAGETIDELAVDLDLEPGLISHADGSVGMVKIGVK